MVTSIEAAVESLRQIKSTEPPVWLVPKPDLSLAVRAASKHLFTSLKPQSPKSPFDQLLIEGFDVEQIWQQIDLQSQPLLSTFRREVKKFEKHPEEISKLKETIEVGKKVLEDNETDNIRDDDDHDEDDDDIDENDDDDDDEEEEEEEEKGREDEDESEGEEKSGIEDKFLKIKELQEYLEEDETREFGLKKKKRTETKEDKEDIEEEDDEEEENDDDNDEEEEEEDGLGLCDGDDKEDEDNLENAGF